VQVEREAKRLAKVEGQNWPLVVGGEGEAEGKSQGQHRQIEQTAERQRN